MAAILAATSALSPTPCLAEPLYEVVATANFLPNVWKSKGSLSYESEKALKIGEEKLLSSPSGKAAIILSVAPNKNVDTHPQSVLCARLESRTAKEPLHYAAKNLASLEAVSTWIAKLSRGSGIAGNDLYRRCPGSCSPRYRHRIYRPEENSARYSIESAVVCGPVRDKDDNRFTVQLIFEAD